MCYWRRYKRLYQTVYISEQTFTFILVVCKMRDVKSIILIHVLPNKHIYFLWLCCCCCCCFFHFFPRLVDIKNCYLWLFGNKLSSHSEEDLVGIFAFQTVCCFQMLYINFLYNTNLMASVVKRITYDPC